MTPASSCAPPGATRKPEMTSSKIEQRAGRVGALAQQLEEALGRRDEAHVRRKRLGEDRGELVLARSPRRARRRRSRARRSCSRRPRRARRARPGCPAWPGRCRRRRAARRRGRGRRRRTSAASSRPVAARARRIALIDASVPDDVMRSISTPRHAAATSSARSTSPAVGAPKLVPRCGGVGDRRDDRRVRVAVDQRAPRADPVDVAVAVDVEDLGARAALDEERVAADRAHRADRRVHAAGQDVQRARVELGRARVSQRDGHDARRRARASQFLKSSVKYRRRIFLNSVDE